MSSFDASFVINVSHLLLPILLVLVGAFGAFHLLRTLCLPRPLPGIPYNRDAVKRICGDMDDMYTAEGGRRRWVWSQPGKYGTVLCQAFLGPLRRPTVIVSDYETAVDICCRRAKEFDRGGKNRECVGFVAPNFHFTMESRDPRFKANREMLRGLMSRQFLEEIAAPKIDRTARHLVELWRGKAAKAQGNAFSASHDLYLATLDMISGVAFNMDEAKCSLRSSINQLNHDSGMFQPGTKTAEFAAPPLSPEVEALLDIPDMIAAAQGSPFPFLAQMLALLRNPKHLRCFWRRRSMLMRQTDIRLARPENSPPQCALDSLLQREKKTADETGRDPDFYSPAIRDEILGYLLAGHDTTATVLAWWLKHMIRHQDVQARLREALWEACPLARSESRLPTTSEILALRVPYLDAVIEETSRCAKTATLIAREATCDTVISGYRIPKGTGIFVCLAGPGMTETRSLEHSEKAKPVARMGGGPGVPAWPDDDIATFNPERWLKKETDRNGHVREIFDPKAGPNLAFSIGPRQCFGKKQALLQLKFTMARLTWSFEFDKVKSPLNTDESDRLNSDKINESLVNRPEYCYVTAKTL